MSEMPLPGDRGSAETFRSALENLLDRYDALQEPVNYKEAALGGLDNTACSAILKYFSDIGLIKKESQGNYIPDEALVSYHKDDFSIGSGHRGDVVELVEDYEILREANFLRSRNEYEGRELAEEIVEIEDDLSSDDVAGVGRAVEILAGLNLLDYESQSNQEGEESERVEQSEDDTRTDNSISEGHDQVEKIETGDLPSRSDPDRLNRLLTTMKDGGNWGADELSDDDDLDMEKRYVTGTLDYGEKLGFIEQNEEGSILTRSGYDLAYEEDEEAIIEKYRESVSSFRSYSDLLFVLYDKEGPFESGGLIENSDLLRILRTEMELTEPSSDRLKRSISTFFKTLGIMDFGEFKSSSGQYPTRFSMDEGVTVGSIIETLELEVDSEPPTDDTDDIDVDNVEPSAGPLNGPGSPGQGKTNIKKRAQSQDDRQEVAGHPQNDVAVDEGTASENGHKDVNIDVNIRLDLSEMDTAEFKAKMEIIRGII